MKPQIHPSCYIDETAVVIGDVIIEEGCSVWPNAVIRGDLNHVLVQEGANVQDNCVIHVTEDNDTIIGKNTSLGHGCVVHGSHIDENCIIGMNACILDGSEIGKDSIIGAGAVVKAGTKAGSGSLLVGLPAKIMKSSESFEKGNRENAERYHRARDRFRDSPPERYRPQKL